MKRLVATAACAILSIGMLTACGGGNDEYCSAVKDTKKSVGGINGSDATSADFKKATNSINDIADKAPDSVKDDWKTIGKTLQKVLDAVDDAGLKIEDLQDPAKAKDIDPSKLKKISEAAKDMSKVNDAQDKVTKEVKKDCDIKLGSKS